MLHVKKITRWRAIGFLTVRRDSYMVKLLLLSSSTLMVAGWRIAVAIQDAVTGAKDFPWSLVEPGGYAGLALAVMWGLYTAYKDRDKKLDEKNNQLIEESEKSAEYAKKQAEFWKERAIKVEQELRETLLKFGNGKVD